MAQSQSPVVARKQLLVSDAQKIVVWHVVRDWAMMILATWSIAVAWQMMTYGPYRSMPDAFAATWERYGPILIVLLSLIPLVARRTLDLTNRAAGPLMRFSRALRALTDNKPVKPMKLRANDFGQELADDFNRLLAQRIRESDAANSTDSSGEDSPTDSEAVCGTAG